jgi:hypothetical protein
MGTPGADDVYANVVAFGAKGDGVADDTAAVQSALASAAATGKPVYAPPGTYVITRPLTFTTTSSAPVTGSLRFLGAGPFATRFDNRVAGGALLSLDTSASLTFQAGGELRDFTILNTQSPADSDGIHLHRVFQMRIENVRILGGPHGSGIVVSVTDGDADSSVQITLSRVFIDGCTKWGVDAAVAPNHNELSWLRLDHTFIQESGTASSAWPPTSGGMRWKGQILELDGAAFSANQNVGLYIYYNNGGTALDVTSHSASFENNVGVSLAVEALTHGWFENTTFYNNDQFVATKAVLLATNGGSISDVSFRNTIIRPSAQNNNYTAFTIGDTNVAYTVIEGTRWQCTDNLCQGSTQHRFSDNGLLTRIVDDGAPFPIPSAYTSVALNGSTTSYQPDATRYKIHRINLTAPGPYSISAPNTGNSASGKEMILDIYNSSAGAAHVSFGFPINVQGYSDPAPGAHHAAQFYFNGADGWVQVGAWSP